MVALLPPAHPSTVPSSVANRNRLGAGPVGDGTTKSEVMLETVPVGVPVSVPSGAGICTVRFTLSPAPGYSVDTLLPLSETQIGLLSLDDRPHGLTSSGSFPCAIPG